MRVYLVKLYEMLESIPDRLYPFASDIEGRWVRGKQSYQKALERASLLYGKNHLGYKLVAYRSLFHLSGSIAVVLLATFLAETLFGSQIALYVMAGVTIAVITAQEFYLHPRSKQQVLSKGVIDWLSWTIPIIMYLLFFVY